MTSIVNLVVLVVIIVVTCTEFSVTGQTTGSPAAVVITTPISIQRPIVTPFHSLADTVAIICGCLLLLFTLIIFLTIGLILRCVPVADQPTAQDIMRLIASGGNVKGAMNSSQGHGHGHGPTDHVNGKTHRTTVGASISSHQLVGSSSSFQSIMTSPSEAELTAYHKNGNGGCTNLSFVGETGDSLSGYASTAVRFEVDHSTSAVRGRRHENESKI